MTYANKMQQPMRGTKAAEVSLDHLPDFVIRSLVTNALRDVVAGLIRHEIKAALDYHRGCVQV